MKSIKYMVAIAIACVSLGLASQVSAVIIDLGQTTGQPADIDSEFARLTGQIALYNASNDPDLPTALREGAVEVQASSDGIVSIDIDVTGFCYIKLKWDGLDQFYFVGDDQGIQHFDSTVFNRNGQPQALSHYVLYDCVHNNVPDGGATAALLGLGLAGLGGVRARFGRK